MDDVALAAISVTSEPTVPPPLPPSTLKLENLQGTCSYLCLKDSPWTNQRTGQYYFSSCGDILLRNCELAFSKP